MVIGVCHLIDHYKNVCDRDTGVSQLFDNQLAIFKSASLQITFSQKIQMNVATEK